MTRDEIIRLLRQATELVNKNPALLSDDVREKLKAIALSGSESSPMVPWRDDSIVADKLRVLLKSSLLFTHEERKLISSAVATLDGWGDVMEVTDSRLKGRRCVPAPIWRADVRLEIANEDWVPKVCTMREQLGFLDPTQDYEIVIRKKVKR